MIPIDPLKFDHSKFHRLLLGSIAPRPIALASTIDADGNPNLSPFSFFNAFGVNPATLIFSPSRRGRDNTTKHTYQNLREIPEVVINVVTYNMVQQVSLSSTEYPKGVNEFVKAGLTPLQSERIRPYRVSESPVQFECKVREIIETGDGPGAGNLVICDILLMHVDQSVLNDKQEIDQEKIDLVGRMGGDYYVRTSGNAKFIVPKPLSSMGIGIDRLPEKIRFSPFLSGNDLGHMGNLEELPDKDLIQNFGENTQLKAQISSNHNNVFTLAKNWIAEGRPADALALLMAFV
ncbi:MAG: flavin reductase family protein [Bacteroidales bacterium]|nr:flavin reductase family protein [Bacteroidales bacterium]